MLEKLVDKYKKIPVQVKASFWFLICAFFQKGISVITTPIFTRLLNTKEYGAYSVWNSWMGIITVFVSLNLYYGVFTSGLVRYEDDRKNFVSSLVSLNTLCCGSWLIFYLCTRNFWNALFNISTTQMLAMLLIIWTTSIFSFWSAEQRVDFKYKALVFLTIAMSIAKPALGCILVIYSTDKVTARIIGLCIVELLFCVPLFIWQWKSNRQFINIKYWKYAFAFNIPLIPHYLSQVILNSSDRIMIGSLIGNDKAGIYNLAYSVALLATMFNTALMQTIEPWMYKKIKNNEAKDITRIAYGAFTLIAVVNMGMIILGPEVIAIFAPASYREAIWLIPPIAMSVYFMFQYTFFAVIEFYYKKTKYISIATMIGAVINLVTNYIFIPRYGYMAASYTTLGCYILYTVFHYLFMRKLCRENLGYQIYNSFGIMISSVFFLAVGFGCMALYEAPVVRYAVIIFGVVLMIIFRRKIIGLMKTMLNIRWSKS